MISYAFARLRAEGFIARPGWRPDGDPTTILCERALALRDQGSNVAGAVYFFADTPRGVDGTFEVLFERVPTPFGRRRGLSTDELGRHIVKRFRQLGIWCEWDGKPGSSILVKEN